MKGRFWRKSLAAALSLLVVSGNVPKRSGADLFGGGAFAGCKSLSSITIPVSVESIGADAFYNCTGITDVYCYTDPSKLTWDEYGCDDFIQTPKHTTVCHVPKKYIDDYNANFGSVVNVKFVGALVDMGLGEHLYGHSITLDGSIGVNFYVELTDELLASETAEMIFTIPNGSKTDTQTLLVKDVIADNSNKVVIGGKTYYKFKCSISAKDMASEITAQIIDGDKALGEVSIPDTFKYKYADNATLPEGVTFEGATLSLKSETTLSLYFKGLSEDTKFTCGGKTVETANNGEYVVARIRGIKASELENDFTVKFGESSETYNVTYNVMTYC